jgi:O-antigen ligase
VTEGTIRPVWRALNAPVIWGILAVSAGLLVASQPLAAVVLALAVAAFGLLALITPLATLVVLLILAPLRTLIATESSLQLPLDIGQLALAALLLCWVFYRAAHERRLPRLVWSPTILPVLLFIIAISLSAFGAISLSAWLNEWLKWVQVLILILFCLDLAADQAWEWLIFGLILSGVANALIGIYEFMGGSGALHLLINDRFFRAFGTFGQPNPFGGFMGLLAPIALTAALGYSVRARRFWHGTKQLPISPIIAASFYIAASGLLVVGVIVSWSRGAWLGYALSLGAVLFALPRRLWQSVGLVVAVTGIIGGLWLTGRLPLSVVSRISSAFEETFATADVRGVDITSENYALIERLAHWQAAVNMATDYPWLGVGFGNYEVAYPRYRLINWKFPLGHAHNYYLNVLAETGIIGLVAYIILWVSLIVLTWRTRRHPDPLARFMAVGLFGSWVYLATHSLTDNLYVNNLFLHLGIMIGTVSVLYNQVRGSIRLTRIA